MIYLLNYTKRELRNKR